MVQNNVSILLILKIALVFSILPGCEARDPVCEFLENYKDYDFSAFSNKALFIRGFEDGNTIIFIYDYSSSSNPCGFERVLYSKSHMLPLSNEFVVLTEPCHAQEHGGNINALLRQFIRLEINYLKVDSLGNVFVKPYFDEGSPRLKKVRVSPHEDEQWVQVTGNWYISP